MDLTLNNYRGLNWELTSFFQNKQSQMNKRLGEENLLNLLVPGEEREFFIRVYGELWAPGLYGEQGVCLCVFTFGENNDVKFSSGVYSIKPDFWPLLLAHMENLLDNNWGKIELEKKQALADWITEKKRTLGISIPDKRLPAVVNAPLKDIRGVMIEDILITFEQ
ncbi:MAG: hypothetical protein V1867_07710 [Candidatus Falkowbacteria bacterium]